MEKYDVVVIGGGLGSLTTATYLSKRLRNVAVFEEGKRKKLQTYTTKLKDDNKNTYEFKYYNYDLGGVHPGDLFYEYMKRCGLQNAFEYTDNEYAMIVNKDRRITKRPNDIKNFKIYLVRHFPKQRDQIHRLFDDIMRHYEDFRTQKHARLNNKEYTLPSLLIEWGDLSLYEVLIKYFNQLDLINEFSLVYDVVGMEVELINAYNYFVKFFDTFIDGSHFIKTSFNDIVKTFSAEISKSREKIFTNRQIAEFVVNDDVIEKIIDTDGNEIVAKHYVINMRIDEFIEQYLPSREDINDQFKELYKTVVDDVTINQVYLGLDKEAESLGLKEMQYIFSHIPDDSVRLLSIQNYKAIDADACKNGQGAILVEFLDDDSPRKEKLPEVINQVLQYFPELNDHIVTSKIGVKRPYFSGIASKEFWKSKTINDLFDIDNYSVINPLSNGYFIGSWVKPEAGITGMIQTGVEYGDIIDDLIYHGDDEDYFITHDELMNIITHQFIPNALGKEERNIQFFIGKDSYYIRTKGKHVHLYKGVTDISDLILIVTNETLYDLSVGNTTLEKALDNGSLEYVGDPKLLEEVIEGFDMGIEIESAQRYKYVQGKHGIKFMLAILSLLLLSNLLANYHNYLIIAPATLVALGAILYVKYRVYRLITVFEYFLIGLYSLILIAAIIFPEFNEMKESKYTLLVLAVYMLTTWLIKRPIAFGYIRHDYRTDYTRTKLFINMCGGLTFIWGVIFLILAGLSFLPNRSYSSLAYYIGILGLALTFYYPTSYIKGNIDK